MLNMCKKQKLFFKIEDENSEGISLTEALAGSVGTVNLGSKAVHLWVPGDEVAPEKEMVFDLRQRPVTEKDVQLFKEACKGHFMPAYVALVEDMEEEHLSETLKLFDYVLTPNGKIKNTPADFRARVLSYQH